MQREDIARVAHEVNRAYCLALGDLSQPAWEDAPEWQKKSALTGVALHLDNPEASAAASHESWLAEKERDGWVYGPVKDPALKQHPCMVPFEELPIAQQAKDYLFRAVVHSLALHIDTFTIAPDGSGGPAKPKCRVAILPAAGTRPTRMKCLTCGTTAPEGTELVCGESS